MERIEVWTDGACKGNPGRGGSAAILIYGDNRKELSKGYKFTTNNRMELMSVIIGLEEIKKFDIPVTIYSDSQYVCKPFNLHWIDKWILKDFDGIKNIDLWKKLLDLVYKFESISFVWVKGHASTKENNNCDVLAVRAANGGELEEDFPYLDSQRQKINQKNK